MPVTSSASSVKRWPNAESVMAAARAWAVELAAGDEAIIAVGCFGSYAQGVAGFGSDLDFVLIRRREAGAFDRRGAAVETLPVPADVLVYDVDAWRRLQADDRRMARVLRSETLWLYGSPPETAPVGNTAGNDA